MRINSLIRNSDKTELLVLGQHATRRKLSDYTIILDGLSVPLFAKEKKKNFAVIVESSLFFEAHIDCIRTALFSLRNITKMRNILSQHDVEISVVFHVFLFS